MAPADFAGKFELLMKLLSVSRARVAADLGIDKSVVNRWARGDTLPTPQNLGALTALVARRRAGFTRLDWDRDLANLAAMFGATLPSPGPRVAEGPGAPMDVLRASRA